MHDSRRKRAVLVFLLGFLALGCTPRASSHGEFGGGVAPHWDERRPMAPPSLIDAPLGGYHPPHHFIRQGRTGSDLLEVAQLYREEAHRIRPRRATTILSSALIVVGSGAVGVVAMAGDSEFHSNSGTYTAVAISGAFAQFVGILSGQRNDARARTAQQLVGWAEMIELHVAPTGARGGPPGAAAGDRGVDDAARPSGQSH